MELKVFVFSAVIVLYKVRLVCSRSIQKRSVFQLCNLIQFHSDVSCLTVNDYGCFCGLGQNGDQPLDNIDRCCYEHDTCYGDLNRCYWYIPQLLHYWYTCDHETETCTCTGNWLCQHDVCECDLQFARCLKDAFSNTEYNVAYKNYNLSRCV
ncbi:basic phospholipase A2 4-like [Mizuhopecten yessoensis]|uniref:Phospholipase A2 n=1 Tax=Mizuhopecten yessoensis TaxID=6573 RepID=A0A210Q9W5_MIZYE|nr:basic phospholipase A2 4-like [Mizuhopecten yessoensis]XP_021363579.1 basic phospholipase A2 4-like [Mizuhopecten yessoensis]OWF45540.1 Basic phospholipase A2 notechis 11'2 [Mizuhopecten yessoensis]